jgi:predicted transposase YdaD
LSAYEEERKVPYITSVERIGYERGQEEGREKGREEGREEGATLQARTMLLRQLTRRFGAIDAPTLAQINALPIGQLEALSEALIDFTALDDLTTWLDQASR